MAVHNRQSCLCDGSEFIDLGFSHIQVESDHFLQSKGHREVIAEKSLPRKQRVFPRTKRLAGHILFVPERKFHQILDIKNITFCQSNLSKLVTLQEPKICDKSTFLFQSFEHDVYALIDENLTLRKTIENLSNVLLDRNKFLAIIKRLGTY